MNTDLTALKERLIAALTALTERLRGTLEGSGE